MRLVILGYGKMGKALEKIALERKHTIIALQNDSPTIADYIHWQQQKVTCVLEFTQPSVAHAHVACCIEHQLPVVCGTTGWFYHDKTLLNLCKKKKSTYFHATNFSIGANIVQKANIFLARMIQKYPMYHPTIQEVHHTEKLDIPSGTAITLAEGILTQYPQKIGWQCNPTPKVQAKNVQNVSIIAKRLADNVGTHQVTYHSSHDTIQIIHQAKDRRIFALGALLVAEWIQGKKGIFSMEDFLNF